MKQAYRKRGGRAHTGAGRNIRNGTDLNPAGDTCFSHGLTQERMFEFIKIIQRFLFRNISPCICSGKKELVRGNVHVFVDAGT